MTNDPLLSHLRKLEVSLHQPAVRRDSARVDELLDDDFVEIGRSGRRYTRDEIVELLGREPSTGTIDSRDFELDVIAEGVALLTYRSARVDGHGARSRPALRSSLWVRDGERWRLRFHQATATVDSEP